MVATSRRVSYILPAPNEPPPYLQLPPIERNRRGHTAPFLMTKSENGHTPTTNGVYGNQPILQSKNPFLQPGEVDVPSITTPPITQHPRHCLGITSLALDTSTVLANENAPGGILYSGGRDGLVVSWELSIPHKRRRGGRYESLPGRGGLPVKWERIGDGAEFFDEDDEDAEEEDEGLDDNSSDEDRSDDWVGGGGENGRKRPARGEVPYEDRWEVDRDALARRQPPASSFRQSAQTHTDWVNAMLLCNLNQTVVTASSDRTIRAWSPHAGSDEEGLSPSLVGTHRDYVRSLAWAKYPALLFSGSLDRTLSVWDIQAGHHDSPVFSIDMNKTEDYGGVGMEGERGSVYALGVDPAGKVLAAGTPERVVRLWDPRQGERSTGKLIGHSDCVRSVIVSEDGRYMLTGSSDTTIKLWSLAAHRCLHTFNHHTSSVWALHSLHPNLERFYSGSRDGHLCVVDLEQCTDMSEGECVVLAKEGENTRNKNGEYESKSGDEGIRCIVSMDDEYVWTATGSAEVKRWRDVGRKVDRSDMELDGVSICEAGRALSAGLAPAINVTDGVLKNPLGSLDNQPGESLFRTESRESRSVAFAPTPAIRPEQQSPSSAGAVSTGMTSSPSGSGIPSNIRDRLNPPQIRKTTFSGASIASSIMSDSSVADDGPLHAVAARAGHNGIPYDSLVCLGIPDSPYSFGFSSHRQEEGYTIRSGASHTSLPHGHRHELEAESPHKSLAPIDQQASAAHSARIKFEDREIASEATPLRAKPDEVIAGRSGLVRSIILNDRQHVLTVDTDGEVACWNIIKGICVGRFSAADVAAALDLERGISASNAVRKHSNEVLELVKERVEGETMVITWCQVDTKIGSLVVHLEEGRVFDAEVYADELDLGNIEGMKDDMRVNLGKWTLTNLFKGLIKAEEREVVASSPSSTTSALPSISRSPAPTHISIERPLAAPAHRRRTLTNASQPPMILGIASPAATPAILPDVDMSLSRSAPTASSGWQSMQALRNGPLSAIPQSPGSGALGSTPGEISKADYFSIRKRADPSPNRGEAEKEVKVPPSPGLGTTPQTPGGSFMGKLKGLGKKGKSLETNMMPVKETEVIPEDEEPKISERDAEQLRILDTVRSHPFRPPPPWEAPPLDLPPSTSLLIAEESKDAGAWVVTYRSQVSSTERDMEPLENNSPLWLLDYLFTSRIKIKDPVKLTFILEPAPNSGLKEMPEGTTRLSASRVLRAKKIITFIYEKLEMGPHRGRQSSIVSLHSRITSLQPKTKPSQAGSTPSGHSSSQNLHSELEPEETLELLCGPTVVDPRITLATLKQYHGSGGDMLLHYRLKEATTGVPRS